MTGIMNSVKGGADLTKPKPSVGYVVGGVVAAVVLGGIVLVALFFWGKVSQSNVPVVSQVASPARVYIQ